MSKYQLSPDQIRERANKISNTSRPDITKDILALIEEATGEKIPEPFDESKVKTGAVLKFPDGGETIVLVGRIHGGFHVLYGDLNLSMELSVAEVMQRFQNGGRYIGQFNFLAGLPKEAA